MVLGALVHARLRAHRGRHDRSTGQQIEPVLDEFEKTAWAGLEPDSYARIEQRSCIANAPARSTRTSSRRSATSRRAEASTSRPPGWQQTFPPLRDAFNHQHDPP